jgi:hypothetical protein
VDLKQGFNQIMLVAKDCKKKTFHGSNKLWGMACDAFWIEGCTYLLSMNHGSSFQRGKFPEVLHR